LAFRTGGPPVEPAPDQPPKYQIRGLDLFYHGGRTQVLHRVGVDIGRGLVTAVIGPSGCGKSSFLQVLNRMVDEIPGSRVEGLVELDGDNLYREDLDVVVLRRRVGMVFQAPNPFPRSIWDNVAFGPRVHGVRSRSRLNELVEASLRRAALWDEVKDRLHHPALGLSGGQQQRLCIARALAVGPEVLLMDEPCSALDPAATARIEELIGELRGQLTVVIVTHNLQQAARVADVTAFFLHGQVVEVGPTAEFFTRPRDRRTEDYVTGRYG